MPSSASTWLGHPSTLILQGATSAQIVAARGGKIVSLQHNSHEWLTQLHPGHTVRSESSSFLAAEMCGWDECAPSIEAARHPNGTPVPGHGELWDQSWHGSAAGWLSGNIPSMNASLSRRVSVRSPGDVLLEYRLRQHDTPRAKIDTNANTATATAQEEGTPFLWAAHPQFLSLPGDTVTLGSPTKLWDVTQTPARRRPRPSMTLRPDDFPDGESAKFYADPDTPISSATIQRASGQALKMSWSAKQLPYFGIWIDRARFSPDRVIALEPSTGWFDSLERATQLGRIRTVSPQQEERWWLRITLS